jgi:hypothetical protein
MITGRTRRRRVIIEAEWTCTSCGGKNRGCDMRCATCDHPKEKDEAYRTPERPEAVTDPERLKEARAGRNWSCAYCGSEERNLNGECKNCAAERAATKAPAADPVSRPYDYFAGRRPPVKEGPSKRLILTCAAIAVGALLLAWFLIWLLRPYKAETAVESVAWSTRTELRRRTLFSGSGWRDEARSDAFNFSCQERQRGTRDCDPYDCSYVTQVECRCRDVNCRVDRSSCEDEGNGYQSCDEICDQDCDTCDQKVEKTCYKRCPVYDDWCSYDYYEWPVIRTETASGQGHDVLWPPLSADGPYERIERSAEYTVRFAADGKTWTYHPSSLEDYRRFAPGARWLIKANRAGMVWPQHPLD